MYHSAKKIGYLIAESARCSAPWSMPFNVLASSVRAAVTRLGAERQAAGAKEVARVQAELAKTLNGMDHGALQRALLAIK